MGGFFRKMAAQLLHHFTPSGQITPSLLHHFTPLGSSTRTSFYPLWTNYPLTLTPFYPPWQPNSLPLFTPSGQIISSLTPFYPLGIPTLTSFYPLLTNYPLTLAAPSHMAISIRGLISEKSSHCSPLQPTLLHGNFNRWVNS